MPLTVSNLVGRAIPSSLPILLILLMDLSNLSSQAHDLFL